MTERSPNPVLHLRPAEPRTDPRAADHPTARIVGNRAALLALRDQLDSALGSGGSHRMYAEADGARFEVAVRVAGGLKEMGEPAGLEGVSWGS